MTDMKRFLFIISLMISYLTGNAQNVVDVHCHNIPPFYMEALEKHNAALDEGFPLPEWNVDSHPGIYGQRRHRQFHTDHARPAALFR